MNCVISSNKRDFVGVARPVGASPNLNLLAYQTVVMVLYFVTYILLMQ